jgi:hypothetical protein
MRDPLLFAAALTTTVYSVSYLARVWPTGHLVSPSSLYAALTAIHFAIPGILLSLQDRSRFVNVLNEPYAVEAVMFSLLSLIAVQFGSLLANTNVGRRGSENLGPVTRPWNNRATVVVVAALILVGLITRIYVIESNAYFQITRTTQGELEGPFYVAIRMAEMFPLHALCILAIWYWRPGTLPPRRLFFTFLVVLFAELAYWLPTGRKEPVLLALLLPVLIRYFRLAKLPSAIEIGTLLVFGALLFPATFLYRVAMETTGIDNGVVETVIAAAELAETGSMTGDKTAGDLVVSRLELLESVCASVRLIREGGWEPMLGMSYMEVLLSFVPRVIWPSKPNLHYGTEFGHAAGFLSPGDWLTSISVTYFGEAYLNLGWLGLFPMFCMGLLLGLLYRQLRVSRHRETWLLVYIAAMPTILYIGGTFALNFGGLIKLLPFFYLVGRTMEISRINFASSRFACSTR